MLSAALSACGTTYPDDLRSLQSDAMAAAQLTGAEVSRTTQYDAELGGLMGKPRAAQIQIAYSVGREADASSVKDEAVELAQAAGWDISDPQAEIVQGTKTLGTGDADIGIYFVEEGGEERLIIRLEHDFDHPTS